MSGPLYKFYTSGRIFFKLDSNVHPNWAMCRSHLTLVPAMSRTLVRVWIAFSDSSTDSLGGGILKMIFVHFLKLFYSGIVNWASFWFCVHFLNYFTLVLLIEHHFGFDRHSYFPLFANSYISKTYKYVSE